MDNKQIILIVVALVALVAVYFFMSNNSDKKPPASSLGYKYTAEEERQNRQVAGTLVVTELSGATIESR